MRQYNNDQKEIFQYKRQKLTLRRRCNTHGGPEEETERSSVCLKHCELEKLAIGKLEKVDKKSGMQNLTGLKDFAFYL